MHLCAHVHQPSTSQQHICIHASTGSSKFFLLSFLSARPFTSNRAPCTHNMCTCVPMFTNHLHLQQHICIHASTGTSKFFLLSFPSAHSLISTPHACSTHNMHICVHLFTNHLHLLAQPICIHTFTDTSKFFFCLFLVYAHPHLHPICRFL